MEKDTRHRRYQLTINNPGSDWTYEKIKSALGTLNLKYYCMADEIGLQGQTPHTHVYFVSATSAIRFSTVKRLFGAAAHIEPAQGTSDENRAYIRKEGSKWAESEKAETSAPGSFEEWGACPTEQPGERTDLATLYGYIKDGLTNFQILEKSPDYMLHLEKIDRARQVVLEQEYRETFRQLETVYMFGPTGVGKTRKIMEDFGCKNVYRVTDYSHPFDTYQCEDVVLFEEFASSLKIRDMLLYLDGYPVTLPARYSNRVACFTKAFIVSNICLSQQYIAEQKDSPATFAAFLRRIGTVIRFDQLGQFEEFATQEYMSNPFLGGSAL